MSTSSKPSKIYTKRKVGIPKACKVCYKLTTTCMYNGNLYRGLADWFYCCDLHLEDNPTFMTPVYDPSYESKISELSTIESNLKQAQKNLQTNSSWDTWLNGILSKRRDNDKNKSGSPDQQNFNTDTETASSPPPSDDKRESSSKQKTSDDELKEKIKSLVSQQRQLTSELYNLKKNVKKFELNDTLYHSKIISIQQKLKNQQTKKIEQESYTHTDPNEILMKFPSVPKNSGM